MNEEGWRRLQRGRWIMLAVVLVWVVWIFAEVGIGPDFVVTPQLAIMFAICAIFWNYAGLR